jgi:hypothetical protein
VNHVVIDQIAELMHVDYLRRTKANIAANRGIADPDFDPLLLVPYDRLSSAVKDRLYRVPVEQVLAAARMINLVLVRTFGYEG